MHRNELLSLLAAYETPIMTEAGYLERMKSFVRAHEDCFHSELLPGHVTGSAWVVNPAHDRVLMLHHKKHAQWFQPGGHADRDADIRRVALRETHEETGIAPEQIRLLSERIFDIDIHTIPASRHGPRHVHYDVRFLIEIDDRLPIPGNDESHDVIWVPLHLVPRYNNNLSTHRMVEKTRHLKNPHNLQRRIQRRDCPTELRR
jgi:8-oxo-dGTP pyrophosphatase MutT (NUDIX family)